MMYFSFLASFGSWAITNDTEHSTRGEVFLNKYPSKIENSSNIVVETFLRYVYSFQAWRYISFWISFFFLSETLNNILREFIQESMAINSMLQKIRS